MFRIVTGSYVLTVPRTWKINVFETEHDVPQSYLNQNGRVIWVTSGVGIFQFDVDETNDVVNYLRELANFIQRGVTRQVDLTALETVQGVLEHKIIPSEVERAIQNYDDEAGREVKDDEGSAGK